MLTVSNVNKADSAFRGEDNPLGIRGIDHVLFYVGNANQAAHYYLAAFGFQRLAYAGMETGFTDRVSWALEQGNAKIVLASGLDPAGPIARHANIHGDSVKDIAFEVEDAEQAFEQAVSRGARPVVEPRKQSDEHGEVVVATVCACGDILHSFVDRKRYKGTFLPGYLEKRSIRTQGLGITGFDHFALSVPAGTLDEWIQFYRRVFGFYECHEENVNTSKSGMRSKVVRGLSDDVVFPIMEPLPGSSRSQIQDYLTFHGGPGVQHAALRTDDIIGTVRALLEQDIEFLYTPDTYYDALPARIGKLQEDVDELRDLKVLVDRDDNGYLFQIFTKAVTGRPKFFIELIQRKGARGFGSGNIRALFEAIELEQAARDQYMQVTA
jgi:4-hydroxyphenylpyruvate dioxygenase